MRIPTAACLLGAAAIITGCNTVRGVASDVSSVAAAFDPKATYTPCGSARVDANGDGRISTAEWNGYRSSGYASWDANADCRISQAEYANCWYGGGFYQTYNRATWEPSYRAFDTNGDGYLSNQEYWNSSAWAQYDRNRDGVIDSSEWPW
jgi:predicted small secreted protein